jgi:magnesium transporter
MIQIEGATRKATDGVENVTPPGAGELYWIDLQNYQESDLETLRQRFNFHPLAIEDCLHSNQRAKVDDYGSYMFVVMHAITLGGAGRGRLKIEEVHGFLGDRYLVTIHRNPIAELDNLWKRVAADQPSAPDGADFLYYLLADALVDGIFPIIDRLSDQIEEVEGAIMERVDEAQLPRLMSLKRTLVTIRRVLSPERDVVAATLRRGDSRISEKTALYLRDVYDHLVRAYEQIDVERDLLGNAMDAYISMMANRTNVIMKQLTLLASIFLPLTFLTGFFGQNFNLLPYESHALFYVELATIVLLPAAMYFWFRKRGWS